MDCPSITSLLSQMSTPRLRALFAQDARRAADWVFVAAAEGLPQAQLCYGRMLLGGTGMAQDPAVQALKWFLQSGLERRYRSPSTWLGCAASIKEFQNTPEGIRWRLRNISAAPLTRAMRGRSIQPGPPAPGRPRCQARSNALAYLYYSTAAGQQHERAMSLVGRCLEEGWGTPRNLDAAADWYRRSAETGYFRGQYNWASMLLKTGRLEEAAAWFERAAAGGTAVVRRAVVELIARAGAPRALENLAARLVQGRTRCSAARRSPRRAPRPRARERVSPNPESVERGTTGDGSHLAQWRVGAVELTAASARDIKARR